MTASLRTHAGYLGGYLRPHRKVLIGSFILSAVSTGLGMIQPYFAKIFIDGVFLAGNPDPLAPLLTALILLLFVGFGIRVVNRYIYTRYSARMLFLMREDLFAHLHRIPLRFFTERKIGDIYSRLASDMADIQALITDTLPQYLFNLLTCLITAAILFWLDWRMALMSLAFTPIALFIVFRLRPRLMDLGRQVAETNADIAHFLFESLGSAPLIRAYDAASVEEDKLRENHSVVLGFLLRYQVLGAVSGVVPTLFAVINTLVVFGYGGVLVLEGSLTVGSLVAFSIYQGRVFGPLQGLLDGFLAAQKARVALARVREILDVPPDGTGDSPAAAPVPDSAGGNRELDPDQCRGEIVFRNVAFAYSGEAPAVRDLSFTIPGGKITALVGPSGAGKTTICNLTLRLFDPDAGAVLLDGVDLKEVKPAWLRKQVALVSQDIFLFHTTIADNIRFSRPDASKDEVRAAARAACIDGFIHSLPAGFDTVIGDRGVRLSGGQKQRISIARAVLMSPRILILDEATAFLDEDVEGRLKATLKDLMKDRTIIVVSHRASTVHGADQIISISAPD